MKVYILLLDTGSNTDNSSQTQVLGVYETLKLAEFHKPLDNSNDYYFESSRIEEFELMDKKALIKKLDLDLSELENNDQNMTSDPNLQID